MRWALTEVADRQHESIYSAGATGLHVEVLDLFRSPVTHHPKTAGVGGIGLEGVGGLEFVDIERLREASAQVVGGEVVALHLGRTTLVQRVGHENSRAVHVGLAAGRGPGDVEGVDETLEGRGNRGRLAREVGAGIGGRTWEADADRSARGVQERKGRNCREGVGGELRVRHNRPSVAVGRCRRHIDARDFGEAVGISGAVDVDEDSIADRCDARWFPQATLHAAARCHVVWLPTARALRGEVKTEQLVARVGERRVSHA